MSGGRRRPGFPNGSLEVSACRDPCQGSEGSDGGVPPAGEVVVTDADSEDMLPVFDAHIRTAKC